MIHSAVSSSSYYDIAGHIIIDTYPAVAIEMFLLHKT